MLKITIVAGARPNFIKIAPIVDAISKQKSEGKALNYRLVHTGQHYDYQLSGSFFEELNIPKPDANLGIGSGSQAEQTAKIMMAFERELLENPCDLVLVVGDVTSTLACSITAKKLQIPVAHVEAGIRSFDFAMPEEINRMVTDSISDYFFTTTQEASNYLVSIGKNPENIHFVGNVMIDTLKNFENEFKKPTFFDENFLSLKKYFVLTLHRPSNVDVEHQLNELVRFICEKAQSIPVVFPIHPRTKKKFTTAELPKNLILTEPLGYLEFNYLVKNALGILTDSGGITEEATVMRIPCITLRENTERPETISIGTNELAGKNLTLIEVLMQKIIKNDWKKGEIPAKWDGKSAERIVEILEEIKP